MKYENSVGTYRRLSADCVLYHVAVNFKLKTNDYKLNRWSVTKYHSTYLNCQPKLWTSQVKISSQKVSIRVPDNHKITWNNRGS